MLLKTVKSRCKKITFNGCDEADIEEYLKSAGQINQSKKFIKLYAQGSIGKIKSFISEDIQSLFNNTIDIINSCYSKSLVEVIKNNKFFINNKENIDIVLDFMILYFKDYYTENIDINNARLYTNLISIIENSRKNLKINAGYEMTIDNMLLRLWEEING
jgi:DNA polymerase-3 subunit delta'